MGANIQNVYKFYKVPLNFNPVCDKMCPKWINYL